MPGLLKSPETRVALCPQPLQHNQPNVANDEISAANEQREATPQQQQPRNMEGLLRFALEATRAEDAAGPSNFDPIDEERRKYLEDALKALTIDVTEVLLNQIKVFDNVANVTPNMPAREYTEAFYTIMEYVDNIDVANDFYKIGGFTIFQPCLKNAHPDVKGGACELLGELCQNNPFCQMVVIDNDFLPIILEILDKEEDYNICVKALHALSCSVRGNIEGLYKFLDLDGLDVMLRTIKKSHDKLRTKSSFFLNALCSMQVDIVEKLVNLGFIPVLIDILAGERLLSQEHVMSLLKVLIENSPEAAEVCRNPLHNFRFILKQNYEYVKDNDEYYEELEYCQHMLNFLFPGWNN